MISPIVQILEKKHDSFLKKYICGLNIFHVNNITVPNLDDLQLEFLRIICEENQVSANTGSLYDFGHTPEELFGNQKYSGNYELVRTGCYGGKFYDSNDWNLFPPLFFPQIFSEFINLGDENESLIYKIMYSDALAFFIAPLTDESTSNMLKLLNGTFFSSDIFIEEATRLYKLIMTTGADADFFTLYSQTTEAFELLDEPLSKVVRYVEESSWYKENTSKLVWDGKYSMCLCLE